jgi:hypothetical protein
MVVLVSGRDVGAVQELRNEGVRLGSDLAAAAKEEAAHHDGVTITAQVRRWRALSRLRTTAVLQGLP